MYCFWGQDCSTEDGRESRLPTMKAYTQEYVVFRLQASYLESLASSYRKSFADYGGVGRRLSTPKCCVKLLTEMWGIRVPIASLSCSILLKPAVIAKVQCVPPFASPMGLFKKKKKPIGLSLRTVWPANDRLWHQRTGYISKSKPSSVFGHKSGHKHISPSFSHHFTLWKPLYLTCCYHPIMTEEWL